MIAWMQDHVALRKQAAEDDVAGNDGRAKLFAPLLPVTCANQRFYVETLAEELKSDVSGLAFYDLTTLDDLPNELVHLPRLGFTTPATPHEVLSHVARGIDLLTIPFITSATDAGIALDFAFPVTQPQETTSSDSVPRPLGIDMWQTHYATDLRPLVEGCQCYACTDHHRAYLQHLLAAKEMLGWVLLQIHNHHVIDKFFAGIRESISAGTFEEEVEHFARVYESAMPEKTGQGPR